MSHFAQLISLLVSSLEKCFSLTSNSMRVILISFSDLHHNLEYLDSPPFLRSKQARSISENISIIVSTECKENMLTTLKKE